MRRTGRYMAKKVIKVVFMVTAVLTGLSFIVMTLWNEVLVDVLGVGQVNFWQAAGLLVLCRVLFGRMGPPPWRGRHKGPGHWRDKWKNMSEEDRQQLRERWKGRGVHKKDE